MRVKYQKRIVSKTFSTNGGTSDERGAFVADIITALYEMGAPFAADGLNSPSAGMAFLKDTGANGENFSIGLASDGSGDIKIVSTYFAMSMQENFFSYSPDTTICPANSKNAKITIHAVKSGDSFFFGFLPYDSNAYNACINYAITPMRKLSDPSVSLGYAVLSGVTPAQNMPFAMLYRALPCIDGYNYQNGRMNMAPAEYVVRYPEVETGKIPLVPYFAGIEDIYYDKVYGSPMRRGTVEEKAFETDKGVFLISGEACTDWGIMFYCTLAFDITEAVNTAQ